MGGWVAVLNENIANSARPAGAGAGAWAELGKTLEILRLFM